MFTVKIYEDNAGGIHAIISEGEEVKNVVLHCEDENPADFRGAIREGFDMADQYDPDDYNGAPMAAMAEDITETDDLIAEYTEGQDKPTVYPENMGVSGRILFNIAD